MRHLRIEIPELKFELRVTGPDDLVGQCRKKVAEWVKEKNLDLAIEEYGEDVWRTFPIVPNNPKRKRSKSGPYIRRKRV